MAGRMNTLRGDGLLIFGQRMKWRRGQLFREYADECWIRAFPWNIIHKIKYWRVYL